MLGIPSDLMQNFPFMFPDTVDVQELAPATTTDTGAVVPRAWQNVAGLTGVACMIESSIRSRLLEGEVTSDVGQISKNSYTVAFDRVYPAITERHRLIDQHGRVFDVTEVSRDSFNLCTLLRVKEVVS